MLRRPRLRQIHRLLLRRLPTKSARKHEKTVSEEAIIEINIRKFVREELYNTNTQKYYYMNEEIFNKGRSLNPDPQRFFVQ